MHKHQDYEAKLEKILEVLNEVSESARVRERESRVREREWKAKEQAWEADRKAREQAWEADRKAREQEWKAKKEAWEADRKAKKEAWEADRKAREQDRKAREQDREIRLKEREIRLKDREIRLKEREAERLSRQKDFNEIRREIKQFGKSVNSYFGNLSNSYGKLVEGVSAPSIQRILTENFEVTEFLPRKMQLNGRNFEVDLIGVTEDEHYQAYVVEVKSQFRSKDYKQVLRNLERFAEYHPSESWRDIYGMIAAPHLTEDNLNWAHRNGIYTLTATDDLYRLKVKKGFEAKNYSWDVQVDSSPPVICQALPDDLIWTDYH